MSLALAKDEIRELDGIAAAQHISRTEAVRRGIRFYRWLIKQMNAGNTIALVAPDGTVTPKEFVIVV